MIQLSLFSFDFRLSTIDYRLSTIDYRLNKGLQSYEKKMIYANAYTTFSSFCQLQVQFRVFLLPADLLDFPDDAVALYSCLLPQIVPFDRGYIDGISREC